jgi:hypothetical protein
MQIVSVQRGLLAFAFQDTLTILQITRLLLLFSAVAANYTKSDRIAAAFNGISLLIFICIEAMYVILAKINSILSSIVCSCSKRSILNLLILIVLDAFAPTAH